MWKEHLHGIFHNLCPSQPYCLLSVSLEPQSRGSFIRGSNGEKEVLKRTVTIKQELCISGPQICVDNNWNLFDIQ